jgi:putative transposase
VVGRRVQLVFDPFDLTHLQVRLDGRDFGTAIPHELTVQVHPKATAEPPEVLDDMEPTATGIDYLALIQAEHEQATRRTINFTDLHDDGDGVTEVGR